VTQKRVLTPAHNIARMAVITAVRTEKPGSSEMEKCSGTIPKYRAIPWATREETTQGTKAE